MVFMNKELLVAGLLLIGFIIMIFGILYNSGEERNIFCKSIGFDGVLGIMSNYCYRDMNGIQERQRFTCPDFSIESCKVVEFRGGFDD